MDPSILLQPNTLPDVIGGVVALPIGLFLAFIVSPVNMRGWAVFGGLLGAALAATGLYYYVDLAHIPIDGVSYVVAALLVATTGCIVGSLLLNGMFGRDERKRAARARHKPH